ncbi:MAG: phosphate-starvation-inducible PsiE family protein [Alphaproteobacteria bacterium]|nr:phosphate-starvation-inducible PsiE family protein [Alphaproteobacteria bacterium]
MRRILRVYDIIVNVIVSGLVLVMVCTLGLAFADILATLFHLIPNLKDVQLNDVEFREMVTGILDVFIIIELFGTIIDYVRLRRLRLSALIDVVAVFILRDMLAKIYANTVPTNELLVLAVLLMTMVVARSITGRFPPKPNREGGN